MLENASDPVPWLDHLATLATGAGLRMTAVLTTFRSAERARERAMMAQSERERRTMARAAMQRSRKRQKVNGHWQGRLGGDIDTARTKLAVDDLLTEEFLALYGDYPWLDGADKGITYPVDGPEGWSMLLNVTRLDRQVGARDIQDDAKSDKKAQADIDDALVNGWADMVRQAWGEAGGGSGT